MPLHSHSSLLRKRMKKSCPSGKYRFAKTGYCRKKKECPYGKVFNKKTGRCRKSKRFANVANRPKGYKSPRKSSRKRTLRPRKLTKYKY